MQRRRSGRRVAVLGDDFDRAERRRRAKDCTDIMRIGYLVEDKKDRAFAGPSDQLVEPRILERLDLMTTP